MAVYGNCPNCGHPLLPIWFYDEENKRKAVDYLSCPNCLYIECVDDSLDIKR